MVSWDDSMLRIDRVSLASLLALLFCGGAVISAPPVPDYEECRLDSIFPAGGQRGQSVTVQIVGNKGGLDTTRGIVIDGMPGISARDIRNVNTSLVEATFDIAADAIPGRRCVRVLNERSGLTNMLYFVVGRLPEATEQEPNNDPTTAAIVSTPVVVNGRVDPAADADCFRVEARAGRPFTVLVEAQAIDSHGQGSNYGYVDAEVQVLDDQGRIVAEAQDTLSLDPFIVFTPPTSGMYTVRVQQVLYRGYPQAVYRLTLGDVPVATSVFPPGGRRGSELEVEFAGLNFPSATRQRVAIAANDVFPFHTLTPELEGAADHELFIVRGELAEIVEQEPNDAAASATLLVISQTSNGRIGRPGDEDWYRLSLTAGQAVCLETLAHRYLRAPVDTLLRVTDVTGKTLAENDDGFTIDYMSVHDFQPPDSRLTFTAPADGDYFVRVSEQTGQGSDRAVYRLSATPAEPDFQLDLFPDAVPIWGPGTTAAVVVRIERMNGLTTDIELTVENLPAGWAGSRTVVLAQTPYRPPSNYYGYYGTRAFLTITAPPDAPVCAMAPFRIVGRATQGEKMIERVARPMTLYYTSDIGFFRLTPVSRAVVARSQGPWLSREVAGLTAKAGGRVDIPVRVRGGESETELSLVVNLATSGVACSLNPPVTVPVRDGVAVVPLTVPSELPVGEFGIVVARTWRSDIRIGMPGPCTPLVPLRIEP
jgi:hypothetical protein